MEYAHPDGLDHVRTAGIIDTDTTMGAGQEADATTLVDQEDKIDATNGEMVTYDVRY